MEGAARGAGICIISVLVRAMAVIFHWVITFWDLYDWGRVAQSAREEAGIRCIDGK